MPILLVLLALLLLVPARAAHAQPSVEVQAGSLGAGGALAWPIAPELAVRVGGNGLPTLSRRETAGDNLYDAHLTLRSAAALLDWHPAGGGFHLTAGALYDANHVDGDSLPGAGGTYTIGDLRLPVSEVGTLHGRVDFPRLAPYVGVGWSPPPRGGGGLGAFVDLGVAYQGRPRVTLTPEPPPGSPLANPVALGLLAPAITLEEARIERKIDGYRYYPVLALGLAYRF